MRIQEELHYLIAAPRQVVWQTFQDFPSWPSWSHYIKEVSRLGSGWRFRARGQPVVDLILVIEAVRREEPEYLEFKSVPGYPQNVETQGTMRLSDLEDGGTRMDLSVEFVPHFGPPLVQKAADWWVSTFDEPTKIFKAVFEEFKTHCEHSQHSSASAASSTYARP